MTNEFPNNKNNGTSKIVRSNWLSSLNWQVDFYQNSNRKKRVDSEFDWAWFEHYPKGFRGGAERAFAKLLKKLHIKVSKGVSQEWVNNNSILLWEARELLDDELSKLLFDSMLVLRCSSYNQFYFPRIYFEDFVSVVNEKSFLSSELPLDYLGLPLRVFDVELRHKHQITPLKVISTKAQIDLLNSYRQYFFQRNSVDMIPGAGDVVLDCGACIGEISVVMAGLVGTNGEVHLFDPVPLHARYCQLQLSMNPIFKHVIKINVLGVSNISRKLNGFINDSGSISPGQLSIDSYAMTKIDDYVSSNNLSRVNMIKMDIEGSEIAALEGGGQVIRESRPRLAISAYHKPEDIWEIPQKIKSLYGDYKLFFGHHSPIQWESVYYAI
jgi:FkbM family methyltransferase